MKRETLMYLLNPREDTDKCRKTVNDLYEQKNIKYPKSQTPISVRDLINIASETERIVTSIELGDPRVKKILGITPKEQKKKIKETLDTFNSAWMLINDQLEKYATTYVGEVELTKTEVRIFPGPSMLFNKLYLGGVKYDVSTINLPHKPIEVLSYNNKVGPPHKNMPVPILEQLSLGDYLEKDAKCEIDLSSPVNQETLNEMYNVILKWDEKVSKETKTQYIPLDAKTIRSLYLNQMPPGLSKDEKVKYAAVRTPDIINPLRTSWTLVREDNGTISIVGNIEGSLLGYTGSANIMPTCSYSGVIILERAPEESKIKGKRFLDKLFGE